MTAPAAGGEKGPLSFEEWLAYLFDNPPGYRWFDRLADWDAYPGHVLADYLTRLFQDGAALLAPFSNAQVGQSLWFLLGSETDAGAVAFDETVEWSAREGCLRSIPTFFEFVFAARCEPVLSHLSEAGKDALHGICYMWWELFPSWPGGDEALVGRVNAVILELLGTILALDHDACRESALHGLGHWALGRPEEAVPLIDAFLAEHDLGAATKAGHRSHLPQPGIRPELLTYAGSARCGCIL